MRFQKLLILFLVVSLSLSLAFSQTALSVRKSATKGYETPYQMRLDAQAESADARAKEAEFRAAAAKISLEELQRSGDKSDRKRFAQQELDIKAEVARAELDAAQARSEALKSRVDLVKDQANTASKNAADPANDKKAQAKHYDALWLQQLVAKSEKDIKRSEEEVARKSKIAAEATRKAEASAQEIAKAQAKEAARQSKISRQDSPKPSEAKDANASASLATESAKQAARNAKAEKEAARKAEEMAAAEKAKAEREAAKQAKFEEEATRKAQETAAAEQAKADRLAAQKAKAEQDAAKKAQEQEIALREEAAKEEARRAQAEQDAARKAQEMAAAEKSKADREAARQAKADQEALQKAQAKVPELQNAEAEQRAALKAQEIAAAEKASADREAEKQAKLEAEALKKAQAKEAARLAKVKEEKARKAQEFAAAEQAKAERQDREAALKANEEKLREKAVVVTPAPTIAPVSVSDDSSSDSLFELLQKKQIELDAQESAAPAKVAIPVEPQPTRVADVRAKEVEQAKTTSEATARSENFFRAKEVSTPSANPKIAPVVSPKTIETAQAPVQKSETSIKTTDNSAAVASESDGLLDILRRKQAELDAQEVNIQKVRPPTPASEKSVIPPASAAPVAPKPIKPVDESKNVEAIRPPQAKVEISKPVAVVSEPAAQDELLEILRKKQAELDAKQTVTAPRPAPAIEASRPEVKKPLASESKAATDREASNERIRQIEAEIKAKEEAIKKSIAKPAPVQPAPSKKPAKTEESVKAVVPPKAEAQPQAIQNSTATLGSKESRLAELLRKYKSDEITPHDYHVQRAKILAEP